MVTLYTFNISHFAEKARWAMDRTGVAYQERVLLPGLHMRKIRRLGQGRTSVPALVDDGKAVQGSSAIISYIDERWLDPGKRLTPAQPELRARALELETWMDAEIGETARRFFYHHALPVREFVKTLFTGRGPWWGPAFFGVAYPKVAAVIRQKYAINAETAAKDGERVLAAYRRLEEMLANRPYLVGDGFTRADLTLAALTAPIWRPAEHPTRWPSEALYPEALRRWIDQLGHFRIREHALRMYREHRLAPARTARAA